jgi:hypothetical protein
MADDASRLWHLTDNDLLTHFDTRYPQASPWTMWTLAPATNSSLIGSLFRQRPAHEFLRNASLLPAPPAYCGLTSALASDAIPLHSQRTRSRCSKSSHNACGAAPSPPAVDRCGLATWRTPSARWARRTPGWGR